MNQWRKSNVVLVFLTFSTIICRGKKQVPYLQSCNYHFRNLCHFLNRRFCLNRLSSPPDLDPVLEFQNTTAARNRAGIGLSYWPTRLHRLAESIPWYRSLGSIKVLKKTASGFGTEDAPLSDYEQRTAMFSWFLIMKNGSAALSLLNKVCNSIWYILFISAPGLNRA